jgi:hypothetical protein
MSLEQNKQVALESLRVLETGDTTAAERIIAPDFINHEADDLDRSDRGIRGPAGLVATSRWLRGQIVEHSALRDDLGLLRQLGVLPS